MGGGREGGVLHFMEYIFGNMVFLYWEAPTIPKRMNFLKNIADLLGHIDVCAFWHSFKVDFSLNIKQELAT